MSYLLTFHIHDSCLFIYIINVYIYIYIYVKYLLLLYIINIRSIKDRYNFFNLLLI
jgi:hypothetical protein